jgi:Ni,Fe-hydrogenase III small subunit
MTPELDVAHLITDDLMRKVSDDVQAVLKRTLAIAPHPHLPVAVSAGAACIGVIAGLLEIMSEDGRVPGSKPDPECVLLAGLLCARMGTGGSDPIGQAYADLKTLTQSA